MPQVQMTWPAHTGSPGAAALRRLCGPRSTTWVVSSSGNPPTSRAPQFLAVAMRGGIRLPLWVFPLIFFFIYFSFIYFLFLFLFLF